MTFMGAKEFTRATDQLAVINTETAEEVIVLRALGDLPCDSIRFFSARSPSGGRHFPQDVQEGIVLRYVSDLVASDSGWLVAAVGTDYCGGVEVTFEKKLFQATYMFDIKLKIVHVYKKKKEQPF